MLHYNLTFYHKSFPLHYKQVRICYRYLIFFLIFTLRWYILVVFISLMLNDIMHLYCLVGFIKLLGNLFIIGLDYQVFSNT
jgi:hypothetical protein